MSDSFDLIVIGAGPGGYVCAIRAAQLGMKVACVESSPTLGGTCLNVGCIPSKALLESSHHYARASHEFGDHGITVGKLAIDIPKMVARKEEVVKGITSGVEFLFKKNKVKLFRGRGAVKAAGQVEVVGDDGGVINGKNIVIATGSVPIELPFMKFDHDIICDSTDALCWQKVPEQLVVVGGGVIGLELGSVWSRLGAKVTIVEALDKIFGAMDKNLSQTAQRIFQKQGMEFHLQTAVKSCQVAGGRAEVTCEKGGEQVSFSADKVLVAVGRRPEVQGLGVDAAGVKLDERGRIEVDQHFQTNVAGIYAIGDVIRGPMLAHKAEDEGVAVAEHLAGKPMHINYNAIPGIVYTWPEVASIGLTEEECKSQGIEFNAGKFLFKSNGRAKAMGDNEGYVRILARKDTDEVIGAHIVGPAASELIVEFSVAMEFRASSEDLARTMHAHPTLSEVVKEAALDVSKRAIHS